MNRNIVRLVIKKSVAYDDAVKMFKLLETKFFCSCDFLCSLKFWFQEIFPKLSKQSEIHYMAIIVVNIWIR